MKKLKKSYGLNKVESQFSGYKFSEYSIDPEKLKVNPKNPYKPLPIDDYERLKKDIAERGIIDPLIVDQSLILLTGHNRLRIAIELELEEIPIRKLVSEISEKQKEKLMILDNLNRRQLTPEEKRDFISRVYKEEIEKDNRGGNTRSKPTHDGFEKKAEKINVAKKISEEVGISKRQAERIVSSIKKESIKPTHDGFKKEPTKKEKIEKLENEIRSLKNKLRKKRKELKELIG